MAFNVRWLNPTLFLVRIDRQKQFDKRHKTGLLFNAPSQTFMKHNQQAGEIVAIGQGERVSQYRDNFTNGKPDGKKRVPVQSAQSMLPQARPGDTLLFSHLIEGSVETLDAGEKEYDTQYLAHEDEAWRYYWVRSEFAYGVVKQDGSIYTTPHTIFARPVEEEVDSREAVKVGSLFLLKNFKENHDAIQARIDQLKEDSMEYQNQLKREQTLAEMERLTAEKNKIRYGAFHPVYVNEKFNRDCGQKVTDRDVLYYQLVGSRSLDLQVLQLEYGGQTFNVLEPEFVVGVSLKPGKSHTDKRAQNIAAAAT